jgi:5-formyltetrahydrofolate cyclo-ligase
MYFGRSMLKESLRAEILGIRKNYKKGKEDSVVIAEKFLSLPELKKAKSILLYFPHKNEVDTTYIIEKLLEQGKDVILPKVVGFHINPIKISDLTSLKSGYAGIKEPEGETYPLEKVDIIVIPAIAFDMTGHRLGYGKGYYDRLLSKVDALKIGLAYDFQVLEKLPSEPHDIPVDMIITPTKIIRTTGKLTEKQKKEEVRK